MKIRIGTLAYWGWIAVSAATLGCEADNRVGLEPDGAAGSNQNGAAGSSGGASSTASNGAPNEYMALAYAGALAQITVADVGGITRFDQVTGAKLRTVNPGRDGAMLVRDVGNVMAASLLGNLWLFNANSDLQRTIKHDSQVFSLELAPDGSVVYSGGIDGKVRRFTTMTGAEISPALGPDSTDFIMDLSASADGLYVAAAEKDGVHVWSTADGAPVVQLPAAMGAQAVRFAPSGREIAVTDGSGTATYTLPDGTLIRRYVTDGVPLKMAYSFDSTKLALPSIDSTVVRVFDTSTGAELVTLFDSSPQRQNEMPLEHRVMGLSFVERDTHLAVAWQSGRLSKWNVADGTLLWSRFDTDKP
jgi:WD40 repeat protein